MTMALEPYLFLALPEGAPERFVRCLNTVGRWAVQSTASSPWLVWPSTGREAAQAAAERVSRARGCAVEVVSRAHDEWVEGRDVQWFTEALSTALGAAAPQSAARARRLRTEADKLEAFCVVVRAASSAADHDAFADVSRAASKALRAKFGGGSITSAFAWLAGRSAQDALQSVLAGDVELGGLLSIQQVVEAAELARQAEQLRTAS